MALIPFKNGQLHYHMAAWEPGAQAFGTAARLFGRFSHVGQIVPGLE